MSNQQKSLLIIAHEYPPISGGLVMRMLKFSKYLPNYGWQPIIITASPEDCYYRHEWGYDPDLLNEVEDKITLHQIPSPLERYIKQLPNKFKSPSTITLENGKSPSQLTNRSKIRDIWNHFRAPQDLSGLWIPYAYKSSKQLIQDCTTDVILTTGPPHLNHLTGLLLKQNSGKPWVADFRDGWIDNPLFEPVSPTRRKIDRYLQNRIVTQADIVIGVTQHILKSLKNHNSDHSKFHLIHNGFDPQDFSLSWINIPKEPVTFVHLGTIGGYRDPSILINAFKELFTSGRLTPNQVKINFIGRFVDNYEDRIIPNFIEISEPVPHAQAVKEMQKAGVLVLITGSSEGEAAFTSKVFEYLAASRPILALIHKEGELANLLKSYSKAVIASPNSNLEIQKGILQTYQMMIDNQENHSSDLEIINKFDRKMQAQNLASILDSIT